MERAVVAREARDGYHKLMVEVRVTGKTAFTEFAAKHQRDPRFKVSRGIVALPFAWNRSFAINWEIGHHSSSAAHTASTC